VLTVPYYIYLVIYWACVVGGAWALIDAARRRSDAYPAVTNQTKQFWLILLAGGLLAQILFPALGAGLLGILGLAGIIAAIVYLVGVRPKLIEITRGPRY
jgi:hypothetical protein